MAPKPASAKKRVPGGSLCLVSLLLTVSLGTSGCATVASLNGPLDDGRPLMMSGTRFNIAALQNRERAEQRFRTPPPSYPVLDLPFSAMLDFFALSFTMPMAALYEIVS